MAHNSLVKGLALGCMLTAGSISGLAQTTTPAAPAQILFRIRLAQVDANTETILNTVLAPPSAGGSANVRAMSESLDLVAFLEQLRSPSGGFRILAEPNLLTANEKPAAFVAAGQFPVPLLETNGNGGGNVRIVFREMGIRLTFQPATINGASVRLSVKPEVNSVDFGNVRDVNGFAVPAMVSHDGETNLELARGQSFVITDLLDDASADGMSRIPGIFDASPTLKRVLMSWGKDQGNHLIAIVTPEVVRPMVAQAARPSAGSPGF